MNGLLKQIEQFADNAHGTQMRKYTPEKYIVHPIRVMNACKKHTDDLCVLSAALLHDVLEDTDVTEDQLRQYLLTLMDNAMAERTLQIVVDLTDVFVKTAFPKLNRLARKKREKDRLKYISADAQTIKYADIIDNCTEIVQHDRGFAKKFLQECKDVLTVLDKGNTELYRQALTLVDQQIIAQRKGVQP